MHSLSIAARLKNIMDYHNKHHFLTVSTVRSLAFVEPGAFGWKSFRRWNPGVRYDCGWSLSGSFMWHWQDPACHGLVEWGPQLLACHWPGTSLSSLHHTCPFSQSEAPTERARRAGQPADTVFLWSDLIRYFCYILRSLGLATCKRRGFFVVFCI